MPSKARSRRREPQPEHIQRKNYFYICKSGKSADFPDLLFHGEGRNDKRHLPALAPCGSVRAAEKVQPCLNGLRWLLSTSPNFSAEIVRTANDGNRVYKKNLGFCSFARLFTKKFPGKLKIQQKCRRKCLDRAQKECYPVYKKDAKIESSAF